MIEFLQRTLCAAGLLLLPLACGGNEPPRVTRTPSVQVLDYAGLETFMNEQKGRPYLLNIWAIW